MCVRFVCYILLCQEIPYQKQKITNDVHCQFYIVKCSSEMRTCIEFDIPSEEKWKTNAKHSHASSTLSISLNWKCSMWNLRLNRHCKTSSMAAFSIFLRMKYMFNAIFFQVSCTFVEIVEVSFCCIQFSLSFHFQSHWSIRSIINLKFSLNEAHIL